MSLTRTEITKRIQDHLGCSKQKSVELLNTIMVKGKSEAVKVYEVMGEAVSAVDPESLRNLYAQSRIAGQGQKLWLKDSDR